MGGNPSVSQARTLKHQPLQTKDATMTQGDIFVIDDNPINLNLLAHLLRERGYQVRIATSGRRGIVAVRTSVPDLIMLDITMPEMNGYEVCQQLKADDQLRDIPVIFISALDDALDKVKAFEVGGVDYVTKPFQIEEVLARIENQLRISQLQKELRETNNQLERQRAQLLEANQKLKDVEQAKADFTAMLVHDLKSPLTVVKTMLDLLQFDEVINQAIAEQRLTDVMVASERNIDKILDLIQEILEFSRIESQNLSLDTEPVNIEGILRDCVVTTSVTALQNHITVEADIQENLPLVFGDRVKLERVFSNLLSNAVKFTPTSGKITIEARQMNQPDSTSQDLPLIAVHISDTGEGIPAEEVPYVFEPYRQATKRKGRLGVGLGLAIVKRIVTAHKGQLCVESQLGVGSRFTVLLPALSAEQLKSE
ncbi:MAG TPA: hybrid sensor histidine kinase/response regulator [Acidobacteriota bacterium]|nr:hybrid sensor histidine kinase/response regulator [Acidobacteriota bacterium]HMZ78739.1 hybrid sensor histidine kinase/response regulator [Acidobacteriota bacterium]HNH81141.1 hybrid sensor histidine kinase/response regulator [Acidobacteriota bacterium]